MCGAPEGWIPLKTRGGAPAPPPVEPRSLDGVVIFAPSVGALPAPRPALTCRKPTRAQANGGVVQRPSPCVRPHVEQPPVVCPTDAQFRSVEVATATPRAPRTPSRSDYNLRCVTGGSA